MAKKKKQLAESRLNAFRSAARRISCVCGRPKNPPTPVCKQCLNRVSASAKAGLRSVLPLNQAEGFYEAVTELEQMMVLPEGFTEKTFGAE